MYDLNKRSYISTLGELRALLADLPDSTEISGAGAAGAWLHVAKDERIVCIDPEPLYDCYEEYDDNFVEAAEDKQRKAHEARLNCCNCEKPTVANYDDYSTQDRKILTWDRENRESFIDGFTKEELKEMNDYLVHHQFFPLDCEYDEDDRAGSIVCDYVRRWLYEQIELGITSNTRKLFEVVMALN